MFTDIRSPAFRGPSRRPDATTSNGAPRMTGEEILKQAFKGKPMHAINDLPLNYGEFNLPAGISQIPDPNDDAITDAECIILYRFGAHAAQMNGRVHASDECIGEVDGEWVEFRMPSVTVRVRRDRDAEAMAQDACNEFEIAFGHIGDGPRALTRPLPRSRSLVGLAQHLQGVK